MDQCQIAYNNNDVQVINAVQFICLLIIKNKGAEQNGTHLINGYREAMFQLILQND